MGKKGRWGERGGIWRGAGQLDGLHVVGGIEAKLPAVQPPAAPALLILLAQLGELISWEGTQRSSLTGAREGVPPAHTAGWPPIL